jgi:protein-tyrosine phosphatase
VGAIERSLAWDGCFNVRDLGGLETAAGGRTRRGAIVRADNIRNLTASGWQAALDHGMRRAVDLRFESERAGEPPPPPGMEVVGISLFGTRDPVVEGAVAERLMETDDPGAAHAGFYIRILERRPETVAAAVAAVASAEPDQGVVIHCFAGKDRTGIVSALVLAVAGVHDDAIAQDYAESAPNMRHLFDGWIAAAADEPGRELRRRLAAAELSTMRLVLEWLHGAGGVEAYLDEAGVATTDFERIRDRLVDS